MSQVLDNKSGSDYSHQYTSIIELDRNNNAKVLKCEVEF